MKKIRLAIALGSLWSHFTAGATQIPEHNLTKSDATAQRKQDNK